MPLDEAHLAVWIAMLTGKKPLPIAAGCLLISTTDG
jgi:hypothetical protein